MNDRLIHLRIKIKSLVAESAIIHQEANKVKGMTKWGLNHHRTTVVREHCRYNNLAYGFIKGIPYEAMEKKCYKAPPFEKVIENARRFGKLSEPNEKFEIELALWIEKAKAHLKTQGL